MSRPEHKFKCETCGEVDHVRIYGYEFGDKILEDVWFKVRITGKKWSAEVAEESKSYFATLNTKLWLRRAVEHARDLDIAICPKCSGEIAINQEKPKIEPRQIPKGNISVFWDRRN